MPSSAPFPLPFSFLHPETPSSPPPASQRSCRARRRRGTSLLSLLVASSSQRNSGLLVIAIAPSCGHRPTLQMRAIWQLGRADARKCTRNAAHLENPKRGCKEETPSGWSMTSPSEVCKIKVRQLSYVTASSSGEAITLTMSLIHRCRRGDDVQLLPWTDWRDVQREQKCLRRRDHKDVGQQSVTKEDAQVWD